MHARLLSLAVAVAAISLPAVAQYPADAVGFNWTGASGASAGPFCWGFQCPPETTTVSPGEAATLFIRGDAYAAFVIGVSVSATSCLSIPGISHALVLDAPIYVAFVGTLDQLSPILSCPNGTKTIPLTFPANVPPGSSFGLQGFVLPTSVFAPPSLTQAIVLNVI